MSTGTLDTSLNIAELPGDAGVQALRQQAADIFTRAGLPGRRHEDWKYTDISRLTVTLGETWWEPSAAEITIPDNLEIEGLDAYRLVFVAGEFQPQQSSIPDGVQLLPLAELLADDPDQRANCLFRLDESAPVFHGILAVSYSHLTLPTTDPV